jgi:hypothetical protein
VVPVPTLAVTSSTALTEGDAGVGCTVRSECPPSGLCRAPVDLQRRGAGQLATRGRK